MVERVTIEIGNLIPNDYPNRNSWNRVCNTFSGNEPDLGDLDLIKTATNENGVTIVLGNNGKYYARDGNNTVARIHQLLGSDAMVTFTPDEDLPNWFVDGIQSDLDWRCSNLKNWGVENFADFVEKCLNEQFYKTEPPK